MTAIRIKTEGLAELRKVLVQFPKELRDRELKRAVAAGSKIVRDVARGMVPVLFQTGQYTEDQKRAVLKRRKPGTLRNAIRIGFSKVDSSSNRVTYNVFIKGLGRAAITRFKKATGKAGADNPDDPWYWRVWEFGNGVNNSSPFLRPAFDTTVQQQITALANQLRDGIKRVEKRLAKQKAIRR